MHACSSFSHHTQDQEEVEEEIDEWDKDCLRGVSPSPPPAVEEDTFVPAGVCRYWIYRNSTGEPHPFFEHYPNADYVCVTDYGNSIHLNGLKPPASVVVVK